MPTITNLNLSIEKGTHRNRRRVTVTYRINFSSRERLAGSVFTERVTLRGNDPGPEDELTTIYTSTVRALAAPTFIERSITKMVPRSTLDEDRDLVFPMQDEVYARVRMEPFEAQYAQADSSMVEGQFGRLGDD